MRAVIQRVKEAKVSVEGKITGKVDEGFLVLLGVEEEDTEKDLEYMVEKIVKLRVFEDDEEKMNLSLLDIKGEMLVVSQFTLLGDCRKGRRPNFMNAAKPDTADQIYMKFVEKVRAYEIKTETGVFGAHMEVDLCNDGPVTILIDSRKNF
ncbi:MAG: D-aminoacyl-tRNA deacylase [Marinisporobacter sp.]|jgi:D-tyrosyl-tRNA(Tyr) deacylase|nr:D-aminoacyl-tRNA deacylase [Marinisporobacter sp.]